MTAPNIPKTLISDIEAKDCVVFVGAGISQGSGLPGWKDLILQMINWAIVNDISIVDRAELELAVNAGELIIVATELRERFSNSQFHRFMNDIFRRPDLKITQTHELLTQIPFFGAITTNYDNLIEQAYKLVEGTIFSLTQHDLPELAAIPRKDEFFLLKAHGAIERMDTVVLGRPEYREIIHENPAYHSFLTRIFSTKTVLFLGAGLTDPDLMLYLEELRSVFKGYSRTHYALVPSVSDFKRNRFLKDYGIQIISYTPSSPQHPEVITFLSKLASHFARKVQNNTPIISLGYDHSVQPPIPITNITLNVPGKKITVNVDVMVDLGSDITIIPLSTLEILQKETKLAHEYVNIVGYGTGSRTLKAYYLSITVHGFGPFLTRVIAGESGVLGRDIINHLKILLDGRTMQWSILPGD